jgi:hypothetical protein
MRQLKPTAAAAIKYTPSPEEFLNGLGPAPAGMLACACFQHATTDHSVTIGGLLRTAQAFSP